MCICGEERVVQNIYISNDFVLRCHYEAKN